MIMNYFEKLDQLPAKEAFYQLAESFNITTPQQLRDQMIWQGIRRILMELDTTEDGREVTRIQDRIFAIAQRIETRHGPISRPQAED